MALNMAGAISAGAYTAGVVDFLVEALDEWHAAKAEFTAWIQARRAGDHSRSRPAAVPLHDVKLEALSGASAGGMCAAILLVQLFDEFRHVDRPQSPDEPTGNRLFDAWVNQITLEKLLDPADLEDKTPGELVSLLNCKVIDEIAAETIQPAQGTAPTRPYLSNTLTAFLTLTNLRGVNYAPLQTSIKPSNSETPLDETFAWYADRIRFQVSGGQSRGPVPFGTDAIPLHRESPNDHGWDVLRASAKATGAFPGVLEARQLLRAQADYQYPLWESLVTRQDNQKAGVRKPTPCWPAGEQDVRTVNVDGGVTNNNPFELAHDYLVLLNPAPEKDPKTGEPRNPRDAAHANAAVVTIAPFPAENTCDQPYQPDRSLGSVLGRTLAALISQSRFLGESIEVLAGGKSYSRFVIAPSAEEGEVKYSPALQCGKLNAFGGFFERQFRQHDYLLGRRNCQRFLANYFKLPVENPVIKAGLDRAGEQKQAVLQWVNESDSAGADWVPIIPLVDRLKPQPHTPLPDRGTISADAQARITNQIFERGKRLMEILTAQQSLFVRGYIGLGLRVGGGSIRNKLREYLAGALNESNRV